MAVTICGMPSLTCQPLPRQSMSDALKGTWMDRALLLLALLAIVAVWFGIQAQIAAGPARAEIYHADTLLATYPLPQQGEKPIHFQVEGDIGLVNILIDAAGARITSSTCATQRCVLSGAHRHAGDMIACVPNRVLISLRGSAASRFDAIVE